MIKVTPEFFTSKQKHQERALTSAEFSFHMAKNEQALTHHAASM